MTNRFLIKETLFQAIEKLAKNKGINSDFPLTDNLLSKKEATEIEELTKKLEEQNPFPQPLLYGVNLLDGIWQLHYSTAREIRSLNKLPLGFNLQKVYQTIDIKTASFFNIAFVKHSSGMITGNVKVTATFTPDIDNNNPIPKAKINVNFDKRYLSFNKILGLKTPFLESFKVVDAKNPPGRQPNLTITYIDDNCRIGRGGEGSLFILSKQDSLNPN